MTDSPVDQHDSLSSGEQQNSNNPLKARLPGSIYYYFKNNNEYAEYHMDSYRSNNSTYHTKEYLGSVINKGENLFYSSKRGFFHFSLENGFQSRHDLVTDKNPDRLRLRFGDIWVYDDILGSTGFSKVLQNLMPKNNDTLNSLIAFRLCCPEAAYDYAQTWYDTSFAKVLYPRAAVSSGSISAFLGKLGAEVIHRNFTAKYLNFLKNDRGLSGKISFSALLDSTGAPNSIKIPMTALSNHSGDVNNEIRLIYVVDSDSGLPIYFKPISGNIIDNSTLKTTFALLKGNNIDVNFITMDAGYSSKQNLKFLSSLETPFITRLSENLKEYKLLINNYSEKLFYELDKVIEQNGRKIYCKQIPIEIDETNYYAYLCIDVAKYASEYQSLLDRYSIGNNCNLDSDKYNATLELVKSKVKECGRFVLISNINIDETEMIHKYYLRQEIEQVFDVSKTNAALLPLRCHSEMNIRGHFMITFIVTILNLLLNKKLRNTTLNPYSVFFTMQNLDISIYETQNVIDEPTKGVSDVVQVLGLQTEFHFEYRASKNPKLIQLASSHKAGRPKGSFGKPKQFKTVEVIVPDSIDNSDPGNSHSSGDRYPFSTSSQVKRPRGRPKGSPNKPKLASTGDQSAKGLNSQVRRPSGRPKGSPNKPKLASTGDQSAKGLNSQVRRPSGRPGKG
jgi:hypothetical protein